MFESLPVAMGWRNVGFCNYPVEASTVAERLPDALSVDTYDGDAWLSIVPFTNVHVRPRGLPRQVGFDLPELNLRTYVIPRESADAAPGVYFFSLDADGVLGVSAARLFHHLPYYQADISLEPDGAGGVSFTSRRTHPGARPAGFEATYRPTTVPQTFGVDAVPGENEVDGGPGEDEVDGGPGEDEVDGGPGEDEVDAGPGTLAEFLTERYRYYTQTPGGDLRVATVEHPRWPLAPAAVDVHVNKLFEANGFPDPDRSGPHYYSPGVDVVASGSQRVE